MKSLSYSQNMEDMQIAHALGVAPQLYIDIGAGHPIADNVSLYFYERGWQGIVVEPQEPLARLYSVLRPRDVCFQGLIGKEPGIVDFHSFAKFHGLSTTVGANARSAAAMGETAKVEKLPVITLAQLCASHGVSEIGFLKIDVEGAESDVLMGNDWGRYRPKIIVAEAIEPRTQAPAWEIFEPYLRANGYQFVLFDTLNRFYVADEHPAIADKFNGTRIDWASATHMYEIGRAPENNTHPEHELANVLARGLWASLPQLAPQLLAKLILRGRCMPADADQVVELAGEITNEKMQLALGRIACGYDGGQI